MGNRGKREFIQVLRLMEVFPEAIVARRRSTRSGSARSASTRSSNSSSPKSNDRPARLDLGDYPYLPAANVKTTSAADYAVLVSGRAA